MFATPRVPREGEHCPFPRQMLDLPEKATGDSADSLINPVEKPEISPDTAPNCCITANYGYDAANRLTGPSGEAYTYDATGESSRNTATMPSACRASSRLAFYIV